jgi:N-acetylglutamate synthase/N-acetylornithine aminotransferase
MTIVTGTPLSALSTDLPPVARRAAIPGGFAATGGVAGIKASGRPDLALMSSEQGRAVMWGQALNLRTDTTELAVARPELARRLGELAAILDSPPAAATQFDGSSPTTPGTPR